MLKKIVLAVLAVLLIGLFAYGCSSGGGGSSGGGTTVSYGVLMGIVSDTNGTVISGATIEVGSSSTNTNDQGWFSMANLGTGANIIVKIKKTSYVTATKIVNIAASQSTFINVNLSPAGSAQVVFGYVGGSVSTLTSTGNKATVTIEGSSVAAPGGGIVTQNISVMLTPFDPTVSEEANAFPGNYEGVSLDGTTVPIKSFGFIDVQLKDADGNILQLASGRHATVIIPVPSAMRSEAASVGEIPLWFFNTSDSKWHEEGVATYDASSTAFVGFVSHFSIWNCDMPYRTAYISGKVIDSDGNPISGALVKASSTGWSSSMWTGSDGKFTNLRVESGVTIKVVASRGNRNSGTYTFGPFANGTENAVGNLVIPLSQAVQITLTWGANPRDLDSHLTIPSSEVSGSIRTHLFYANRGGGTYLSVFPYADLDTDDMYSYGPEVITITRLLNGVYRYCVHDFAGSSTITDSGAHVLLEYNGGIYEYSPPSGATGENDVWRVFDLTVSNGVVTAITPINDIIHNVSAFDGGSFSPNSSEATTNTLSILGVKSLHTKK